MIIPAMRSSYNTPQEMAKRATKIHVEYKRKQKERIEHLLTLAEGIIPEEQKEQLKLRIKSDVDMSAKPLGYHVEKAIMMIGYLNNEELSVEDVYNKFREEHYQTAIDELKVAEVIRDFSSRGGEFFTLAYESLKPRLQALRINAKLFMQEHPELFQDMLGCTEEPSQSGPTF